MKPGIEEIGESQPWGPSIQSFKLVFETQIVFGAHYFTV